MHRASWKHHSSRSFELDLPGLDSTWDTLRRPFLSIIEHTNAGSDIVHKIFLGASLDCLKCNSFPASEGNSSTRVKLKGPVSPVLDP